MIATQRELDELVAALAEQPALAVDCEMDSMFAYRTSLCVLQVGWEGGEALIDALADLDRTGLARLFDRPDVVKVFHGGENDVGLMSIHWGMSFRNLFDTMAASQVLGHEGVGLAALLQRHFGLEVSKRFQKADWRVRPLPPPQAEYARLDVRHLLPLRGLLLGELESLGRVEEAESEFRRIARARIEERPFDPDAWVKVRGARTLPVERRGALREGFAARDAAARELDRAPYRIMHESVLLDLVLRPPRDAAALRAQPGVSRSLGPEHAARLVAALRRGGEITDLPMPQRPSGERFERPALDLAQLARFDALRAWRQRRARARGVEVARVATNALLMAIVRAGPRDLAALAAVEGMEDWRMREYGADLLEVLRTGRGGASPAGEAGAPGEPPADDAPPDGLSAGSSA